jgi:tetratricopeptide (TPR) repeat protein
VQIGAFDPQTMRLRRCVATVSLTAALGLLAAAHPARSAEADAPAGVDGSVTAADIGRRAGSTPAVSPYESIVGVFSSSGPAEASRLVKTLGERAVPALIEARGDPSPATRAWAVSMLESLGKRSPADAVQTSDNQLLADVLLAYGHIQDFDALPVALSFVNSDRAIVRTAAREATMAYGPHASGRLREAYATLTGEQVAPGTPAQELAQRLFAAYDRARLHDVAALLDEGLARQRAGRLDEAIADFDAVLARQPLLDRRAEMAAAYAAYGESLEGTDGERAMANLRKALRLDPSGAGSSHVRSEIATLEGEDLLSHGVRDTARFEEALALDPANAHARSRLDQLRAQSAARQARGTRFMVAGVVLLLALAGIVVVARKRFSAREKQEDGKAGRIGG